MTNDPHLRDRVQKCVKSRKVESFGLPLSKLLTLLDRIAAKADQPGFLWVQGKIKQTQSFLEVFKERLCLMLMLKADDRIIRITDDHHVTGRRGAAPAMDPQVIHVVQVDVRQDRRNHRPLRSATYTSRYASIFDYADLQPFRDEAQNALVRDAVLEEPDNPIMAHGIKGNGHALPIIGIFRFR